MKITLEFPDSRNALEANKALMSDGLVQRATSIIAYDEDGKRHVLKDRSGHIKQAQHTDDSDRRARMLHLQRDIDSTGVSGTGTVAYGVQFPDGSIVLRWDTKVRSTVIYDSVEDLETISGHGGNTRIVYDS